MKTTLTILAFGIARDILGGREYSFELQLPTTVGVIQERLLADFPAFRDLRSLHIAVNAEYCGPDKEVKSEDEVALIPPVSGG